MNKKYLLTSSVITGLALAILLLMLMPVLNLEIFNYSAFQCLDYLQSESTFSTMFAVASLINVIACPLLILSGILSVLSALNIIKNKNLDKILRFANVILSICFVVSVIMLTVGLAQTYKTLLIAGETKAYFTNATPYFYIHTVLSVLTVAVSVYALLKTKTKAKAKSKKRKK